MIRLGFIGFGEAGYNMTVDFDPAHVSLYAFDTLSSDEGPKGQALRERAEKNHIVLVPSMEELVGHSDFLFCLTSAGSALPISKSVAPLMHQGQIYCDLNSTSPKTKEAISEVFQDSPADFVEGAVMASVPANRTKVPIYLCGL